MREVRDFRSMMGMWEMECTVCEIVNRHEPSDLSKVALNRKDFTEDAAIGFHCLMQYGWLNKQEDGSFLMHPALIERITTRLLTFGT